MSAQPQLSLTFTGAQLARDTGIARATAGAERHFTSWSAQAYAFLTAFARSHAYFSGEEVTEASKRDEGFVQPKDDRAWGGVYQRAIANGVITKSGTAKRKRGHLSVGNLYRSALCRGSRA